MKLPNQKTAEQQEMNYILYVNIIPIFSFQNNSVSKRKTFTHAYVEDFKCKLITIHFMNLNK